jgi:hypothetical protein
MAHTVNMARCVQVLADVDRLPAGNRDVAAARRYLPFLEFLALYAPHAAEMATSPSAGSGGAGATSGAAAMPAATAWLPSSLATTLSVLGGGALAPSVLPSSAPPPDAVSWGVFLGLFQRVEAAFGFTELCWLLAALFPPPISALPPQDLGHEWLEEMAALAEADGGPVAASRPGGPHAALASHAGFAAQVLAGSVATPHLGKGGGAGRTRESPWTAPRSPRWFVHWVQARNAVLGAVLDGKPLPYALCFPGWGLSPAGDTLPPVSGSGAPHYDAATAGAAVAAS